MNDRGFLPQNLMDVAHHYAPDAYFYIVKEKKEHDSTTPDYKKMSLEQLQLAYEELLKNEQVLEMRVQKSEERRRAFMHILSDLNTLNRKLTDQRKAMIHILADYEQERSRLARQTERLDNSRRALMHILQDAHQSNLRLENSRKAMIHIMS